MLQVYSRVGSRLTCAIHLYLLFTPRTSWGHGILAKHVLRQHAWIIGQLITMTG